MQVVYEDEFDVQCTWVVAISFGDLYISSNIVVEIVTANIAANWI